MNKTNIFGSIIIFISAYSPLGLILFLKDYNFEKKVFDNPEVSFTILAISILSVFILFLVEKNINAQFQMQVKEVKYKSNELVNYTIPYMISFFDFSIGNYQSLISFGIFFFILCLLNIKTQSIFINPILAFMGYGLYEVKFIENGIEKDTICLSRIEIYPKQTYKFDSLSRFLKIIK